MIDLVLIDGVPVGEADSSTVCYLGSADIAINSKARTCEGKIQVSR